MKDWEKEQRKAAKRGLRLLSDRLDEPTDAATVAAILDVVLHFGMSPEQKAGGPESTDPEIVIFTNWTGLKTEANEEEYLTYIGDLPRLNQEDEND